MKLTTRQKNTLASISKELLPGLNAVFGMEYGEVSDEHKPLFETENSDRAFEGVQIIIQALNKLVI